MTKSKQPTVSARLGLAAIAVIALLLYLATAAGVPAASAAQTSEGSLALILNEPQAEKEIWEEEGLDERNSGEGEAEEPEEESEESAPPEECNLYATTARLVASDRDDSVHLTVRYEAGEATNARVEYWLKGGRGSLQLRPLRRHMSTQGTIQGSERLSAREVAKVSAARVFVVHLDIPGLSRYCERYRTLRLTEKQESGDRAIWTEPAAGTQPVG